MPVWVACQTTYDKDGSHALELPELVLLCTLESSLKLYEKKGHLGEAVVDLMARTGLTSPDHLNTDPNPTFTLSP